MAAIDHLEYELQAPRRTGKVELFLLILRRNPRFAVGYGIIATIAVVAVLAPWLAPYGPETANGAESLRPPSAEHWLGTDISGMDILSRMLYAPRLDLVIAMAAVMISFLIGGPIGLVVGYFDGKGGLKGWLSEVTMRLADVLQAFPMFVLALALVATLGQSARNVVIAIAFVNIPVYLRLCRSQALTIRERRFVDAAQVLGSSRTRIVARHIFPNAMGPALAQASVNIGWAVLVTAGLSFLGAGVRAPTPEWGSMVAVGAQSLISGQWWPALFPGLALSITVVGFALIGESLELMLDPVRRRRVVGRGA